MAFLTNSYGPMLYGNYQILPGQNNKRKPHSTKRKTYRCSFLLKKYCVLTGEVCPYKRERISFKKCNCSKFEVPSLFFAIENQYLQIIKREIKKTESKIARIEKQLDTGKEQAKLKDELNRHRVLYKNLTAINNDILRMNIHNLSKLLPFEYPFKDVKKRNTLIQYPKNDRLCLIRKKIKTRCNGGINRHHRKLKKRNKNPEETNIAKVLKTIYREKGFKY